MRHTYNRNINDYAHYQVEQDDTLLNFLLNNVKESRSKIKATLQGRGIKVNGKTVTQFDYPVAAGTKIEVSKTKRNNDKLKSRYVKIVYEDQYLVVIEKNIGILSMAAGHKSLNVKAVLDDYFKKTRQRCRAHVVHRLDRDTSGLMIYAKDMETEQILEHNWHDIVFDRRYVAVVSGEMENDEGTIENWLKDNKAYVTYSSPVDNGGKYAITHYRVLDRTTEHSLVEYKLETGRKPDSCTLCRYGTSGMWRHKIRQWRRPYTSPLSSCLYALLLSSRYPSGDGVRDDDSGGVQTSVQVGQSVCLIAEPSTMLAQLIIKLKKRWKISDITYSV